jgi:uncharacterized membrane protein YfcA
VSLTVLLLVPAICFIGGFFSTLAGLGGGLFTLAATSLLLPLPVVVPLNGVLILAGQITRVAQYYRHIDWSITLPFIPGSLVGALAGAYIYFGLPEALLAFLLGCVLISMAWIPPSDGARKLAARIPWPFFWVGVLHTFLSSVLGAGALFQSLIVNSRLSKDAIIATIACAMLFMALFKSAGYMLAGFDYTPWLLLIGLCWAMGILGTVAGKLCVDILPDTYFRLIIRIVVSLFALRLFWQAGTQFLS